MIIDKTMPNRRNIYLCTKCDLRYSGDQDELKDSIRYIEKTIVKFRPYNKQKKENLRTPEKHYLPFR